MPIQRYPIKIRQKAASVFTPRIKLLLVTIFIRILCEISNFRVAFFRLKLKEIAPFSI